MMGYLIALCALFCAQFGATHNVYPTVLAEQLDQYCESHRGTAGVLRNPRAGKAGPPGPPGPPGKVNYSIFEEAIERRLLDLGVETRLRQLEGEGRRVAREETQHRPKSCATVRQRNAKIENDTGGVFDIYPGTSGRKLDVYCDLTTDGGGWTVFQRRMDGSENFERNWNDYVTGFGLPQSEFWMGLENLNRLLQYGDSELRIDLEDWDGNKIYAIYTIFSVADASDRYRLTVGGYHGTAGDSLTYHNQQKFYTSDADTSSTSCAVNYKGGWWYRSCHYSNLNGRYMEQDRYPNSGNSFGVEWYHYRNEYFHSMKFTEMKFRIKL